MIGALLGARVSAAEGGVFVPTPDHEIQNVPHGKVIPMGEWKSTIFPNTVRNWWIFVPAQYKPDGSAALMVFQDGQNYINLTRTWRIPTLFDNLISRGEMPVTIAVFINPGHDPAKGTPKSPTAGSNRSFEYDSLGDRYARFLLEEMLPMVAKEYPYSPDPERHAIAGSSSGGICSFTVAWERPDQFRKVFSHVGSFTNIRGGHRYPEMIRTTDWKPIRVFLQDNASDNRGRDPDRNWVIANHRMAAALEEKDYDYKYVYGESAHNGNFGGTMFPDTMRWLWRDDPR